MLQSNPTKNGTGIEIYGFFDELHQVYTFIHKITDSLDENNHFQKGQYLLLMNFAYEIRKAKDHCRLIKDVDSIDGKKTNPARLSTCMDGHHHIYKYTQTQC